MSDVKPIETYYNGYRFRSRLEARWAVFFDYAFIEYQYEPEGYVLSNGTCYLPDFYLPLFHTFVEIKPSTANEEQIRVAKQKLVELFNADLFSKEGSGIATALFIGEPSNNESIIYCYAKDNGKINADWYPMKFMKGVYGQYKDRKYRFRRTDIINAIYCGDDDTLFASSAFDSNTRLVNEKEIHGCLSTLNYAKLKSRQARFEHGECG